MDTRANLRAGKYENAVPFAYAKVPVDEDRMTVRQAADHVAEQKRLEREQRHKHREEEGRMNVLLRTDLETEHGLLDHPKRAVLWDIAWEDGHFGGYGDVINVYERLVEFLK